MAAFSLPYFADSEDRPAPLPTKEEIETSQDVLSDQDARMVVGIGPHFLVKFGIAIDATEGQNMLFVGQNTSVVVPRVYALYTDPLDQKTYIVMERVFGHSLLSLWPSLSQAEKAAIAEQLRVSFNQLRTLPSPGGYCSLGKRGLMDGVFWTGNSMNTLSIEGPFETEDELNQAMIKKFLFNNGPSERASFYKRAFAQVFRHHPPVFTHGDFQRKNAILRKTTKLGGEQDIRNVDDFELVVIDWEFSGWYPSYWEYSKALYACGYWEDDWNRAVSKVLDEHLYEWAWISMLFRELWS